MTTTSKLAAGSPFPSMTVARAGGGELALGGAGGWRLLIVYRGRHCPICKTYLKNLDGLLDEFRAGGVAVAAVSADPKEKADADLAEFAWRFPLGYGLSVEQMRMLGLYVSEPRSSQETDRPFSEPGLFAVNPDGKVQIIDIANAPFARPDLAGIVRGIKIIRERNYLVRGTACPRRRSRRPRAPLCPPDGSGAASLSA